ncbi:MAG: nucleotidyltransferase domain-containing protein [Chlamydiota bacterium]
MTHSSIFNLFANQTLVQLLGHFFINPAEEVCQSRLVSITGKRLIQVQRALKALEKSGLISTKRRDRKVSYKAERSHPAFEELKKVFLQTISLGDPIRESLRIQNEKIDLIWIFGSVAQGEEQNDSDIDIIFVSDRSLEQLSRVVGPLSRTLDKELNGIFITPDDLRKKFQSEDYFIREIIEKPKIWLLGSDHGLKLLLEGTTPEITCDHKERNRKALPHRRKRPSRRAISRPFIRPKIRNSI